MVFNLLHFSLFSSLLASRGFGGVFGFRAPSRRDVQLGRRDLSDHIGNTLFTPGGSSGLFILAEVEGFPVPVQIDLAR